MQDAIPVVMLMSVNPGQGFHLGGGGVGEELKGIDVTLLFFRNPKEKSERK